MLHLTKILSNGLYNSSIMEETINDKTKKYDKYSINNLDMFEKNNVMLNYSVSPPMWSEQARRQWMLNISNKKWITGPFPPVVFLGNSGQSARRGLSEKCKTRVWYIICCAAFQLCRVHFPAGFKRHSCIALHFLYNKSIIRNSKHNKRIEDSKLTYNCPLSRII